MNSIIQGNTEYCPICFKKIEGQGNWHHIYPGSANRKKSEDDGMKIYVHPECHMFIHNSSLLLLDLQARYQKKWCEVYGTVDDFIKRYGKNYEVRLDEFRKKEWREV